MDVQELHGIADMSNAALCGPDLRRTSNVVASVPITVTICIPLTTDEAHCVLYTRNTVVKAFCALIERRPLVFYG